jgi:hypothetical protein
MYTVGAAAIAVTSRTVWFVTPANAHFQPLSNSADAKRANCTESLVVEASFAEGAIACPRSRITATMEAAINNAQDSRCLSTGIGYAKK